MIAKCIAVLAVVAQIQAYVCEPSCMQQVSGGCGSVGGLSASASPITKNVVARGKYPIALSSCGPNTDMRVPVTTSTSVAPVQERPTVRLSSNIPAPRCISHTCTCYKTIVRPRVHQHIVTVPTVQRYIETTHRPVIENIQYEGVPVNCGDNQCSGVQAVQVVPEVQSCQAPVVQSCQAPVVQACQAPVVQSCQTPVVQTVQALPAFQTCQAPVVQSCQVPTFSGVFGCQQSC